MINKKADAAIIYWSKKFVKENIPFGILKIQKLLWYAQILSFYKNNKFIFENFKFYAWTYGPLNVETWKKWRILLNPKIQDKNSSKWEKELMKMSEIISFTDKDKRVLDSIYKIKKNILSLTLAIETHSHEPYIIARMEKNKDITREKAKSFESLTYKTGINDDLIKKFSKQIFMEYIKNEQ